MRAVFISNFINHHQIPFSKALYERLGADYHFIQTERMDEERLQMGWGLDADALPYVINAWEEEERCRELIDTADLVFAGWTERTDLFLPRMEAGKLTFREASVFIVKDSGKRFLPAGFWQNIRNISVSVKSLCGFYAAAHMWRQIFHSYMPTPERCCSLAIFRRRCAILWKACLKRRSRTGWSSYGPGA